MARFLLPLVALSLLPASVMAATPNAGSVEKTLGGRADAPAMQKAPTLQGEVRQAPDQQGSEPVIHLVRIEFSGNTRISTDALQAVIGRPANVDTHLSELRLMAAKVTDLYREAGYLVAQAYLPAQDITSGVIRIAVLEGTLEAVKLENHSRLSNRLIQHTLESSLDTGDVLLAKNANRALLLVQQLPGVGSVTPSLTPGQAAGSTQLEATVEPASLLRGRVGIDNYGNRFTGQLRSTLALEASNLTGHGDRATLMGVVSEHDWLDGLQASWDVPVGYDGWRVGVGAGNTRYQLGRDFAYLDAYGTAKYARVYSSFPWVLTPSTRLSSTLSVEARTLADTTDAINLSSDKHAGAVSLLTEWMQADHLLGTPASTSTSLTLTQGRLSMDRTAVALDAGHTRGDYLKTNLTVERTQGLTDTLDLSLGVTSQWASGNLDSSEQFYLGGNADLAGYPQGETSGDQGWMVTTRLKYALLPALSVSLFQHQGEVGYLKDPIASGSNHRTLADAGAALAFNAGHFTAALTVARRTTGKAVSDTDHPLRAWGEIFYNF